MIAEFCVGGADALEACDVEVVTGANGMDSQVWGLCETFARL